MQKEEIYKKFEELDKVAALGGGVVRIDKQHERSEDHTSELQSR